MKEELKARESEYAREREAERTLQKELDRLKREHQKEQVRDFSDVGVTLKFTLLNQHHNYTSSTLRELFPEADSIAISKSNASSGTIQFGTVEAAKAALSRNIDGIIVEPLQTPTSVGSGNSGVIVREYERLTDEELERFTMDRLYRLAGDA
jgi:hypothetical protein